MQGFIIYKAAEAVKNSGFIEMFKERGIKYGIVFEFVAYDEYRQFPLPDMVINRTREPEVSRYYEKRKIKVYNSSYMTEIGNDKFKTIEYLRKNLPSDITNKLWCPRTFFLPKSKLSEFISDNTDTNLVIKSVSGHGGSQVFKTEFMDDDHRYRIYESLKECDCIVQEFIDSDSTDMRVYILGGEIYSVVKRHGLKDFRSNFSLGGKAELCELSNEQKHYIAYFINAFKEEKGMFGIDFLVDKQGNLIFNEIEEMVGTRMLYSHSNLDIVEDFCCMLSKNCIE